MMNGPDIFGIGMILFLLGAGSVSIGYLEDNFWLRVAGYALLALPVLKLIVVFVAN